MTNDVQKGFNVTMGIVLALFVIFIVLPMATCAGCMVLGSAASVGTAAGAGSGAKPLNVTDEPGIVVDNLAWKVLDQNPYLHEATYKFDVTNKSTRQKRVSFDVFFDDSSGLQIDRDLVVGQVIAPGATVTVTGKQVMEPGKSSQLHAMRVVER